MVNLPHKKTLFLFLIFDNSKYITRLHDKELPLPVFGEWSY